MPAALVGSKRKVFKPDRLIDLGQAIGQWLEPKAFHRLPATRIDEINAIVRSTGHAEFQPVRLLDTGLRDPRWQMLPLLWLRLFIECGFSIPSAALTSLFRNERARQSKDQVLLYTRRREGSSKIEQGEDGLPAPVYQGIAVERFPGRYLFGFTTFEMLLAPPFNTARASQHWPYDQDWNCSVEDREAPRDDGAMGSVSYAKSTWPKEFELVRQALQTELKRRSVGEAPRMVRLNSREEIDSRPYETSMKIADLASTLKARYKALEKVPMSTLSAVVRQGFVRGQPGRHRTGNR